MKRRRRHPLITDDQIADELEKLGAIAEARHGRSVLLIALGALQGLSYARAQQGTPRAPSALIEMLLLAADKPKVLEFPRPPDEDERRVGIEIAAFRLLFKFHIETTCGADGMHWAECDALVHWLGWTSWEAWVDIASRLEWGKPTWMP